MAQGLIYIAVAGLLFSLVQGLNVNLVNRCPYNINATATDLYNTQESTNVLAADGGSKDLSELSANKDWRGVFYASSTSGPPMPLGGSSMKATRLRLETSTGSSGFERYNIEGDYFNLPFNFYPQTEVGMPLRNVPSVSGASCQARECKSSDSCDETRTTCAYGTKFDLVWCP